MSAVPFEGNPRHLSLISEAARTGNISLWNSFVRRGGPQFRARLAGAQLAGLQLGEINLSGADLRKADLSGASLIRANLTGARLAECNLSSANLTKARASGADFTRADLSSARIDGADFTRAKMTGAVLTGLSRNGARFKAPIKPRSTRTAPEGMPDSESMPAWQKAAAEEEKLRSHRIKMEKQKEQEEQERLNKKLGRRKSFFQEFQETEKK